MGRFIGSLSSSDEASDKKQHARADCGTDDLADNVATEMETHAREQETSYDRAENADHDIANEAKARPLHDLTREPSSDRADDKPNYDSFW